jgi:succinate dehydrogenase / fumarate reductase cytochrome b subunit
MKYFNVEKKWLEGSVSYKWHQGWIAWLLHRITGLLLVLYVLIHFVGFMDTSKVVTLVVWAILCYHSMNGLRIVIVNLAHGAERDNYNSNIWVFWVIAIILFIIGAIATFSV